MVRLLLQVLELSLKSLLALFLLTLVHHYHVARQVRDGVFAGWGVQGTFYWPSDHCFVAFV